MKTYAAPVLVLLLSFMNTLSAGEMMKLTEDDAGKTVELRVGDELEIVLPGNPSTGYVWEVILIDSNILKPDKPAFLPSDKVIGSGGTEVLKLQVLDVGGSDLKLIYHRPFEKNKPPLKTFSVQTRIKK